MIGRVLPVAILAMQGAVMAGDIYRWTGDDGLPHFSDTAPSGNGTVIRESFTWEKTDPGSHGLRHGERRLLDRVTQEAEQRHQARKSLTRRADRRRSGQQKFCRKMRAQLRDTRERALRKHYASELRKNCW